MSERDLHVVSEVPFNAETKLTRQRGPITPAGRHYVRTHFAMPPSPSGLVIEGTHRVRLTADEIRGLGECTLAVTLECAGNGRRYLEPSVPGEQWGLGAVGTAEWTGVPLGVVLQRAGVPANTVEVIFRGADEGVPKDLGRRIAYERSLPIADALDDDVLVAFAMNGASIPHDHGGPLRLVVPGWYGMASVKWLASITLADRAFAGFYQSERYVIDGRPLREIAPRAVITSPSDGAEVSGPHVEIRGYAWSGVAPIERVEVAGLDGRRFAEMRLSNGAPRTAEIAAKSRYAWREFVFELALAPGDYALVARATDAAGNTQPVEPRWNPLGYANNGARAVRVRVVGS